MLSKSVSGQEIGEAAIFENSYKRHATTRCSQSLFGEVKADFSPALSISNPKTTIFVEKR